MWEREFDVFLSCFDIVWRPGLTPSLPPLGRLLASLLLSWWFHKTWTVNSIHYIRKNQTNSHLLVLWVYLLSGGCIEALIEPSSAWKGLQPQSYGLVSPLGEWSPTNSPELSSVECECYRQLLLPSAHKGASLLNLGCLARAIFPL